MNSDWPQVETGVRVATKSDLIAGIPRRLRIRPYPIETRYRVEFIRSFSIDPNQFHPVRPTTNYPRSTSRRNTFTTTFLRLFE